MACPGLLGLVEFGGNPNRSRRVSTQQAESLAESLRHIGVPASGVIETQFAAKARCVTAPV
jgi:hypothetical protein